MKFQICCVESRQKQEYTYCHRDKAYGSNPSNFVFQNHSLFSKSFDKSPMLPDMN